ncbi:MAG: hypothetical protein V7784_12000 [Oceanospirillaceae bacterium]
MNTKQPFNLFLSLPSYLLTVLCAALIPFSVQAAPVQYSAKTSTFTLVLSAPESVQLNKIYRWKAQLISHVKDVNLDQLTLTDLKIGGGMPAHGHGLPTQPIASNLNNSQKEQLLFDIEGLKFQMWGDWQIELNLPKQDSIITSFKLTP